MLVKEREIVLTHENDPAWIMALWKAIHGGDPSSEMIAASVIKAMAPYLAGAAQALTAQQLAAGFASLGAKVAAPQVEMLEEPQQPQRPRQYCFQFEGKTICIELPRLQSRLI